MANRKKYDEKLKKIEIQRKRKLRKKLKRKKILAGRKKQMLNQFKSSSSGDTE